MLSGYTDCTWPISCLNKRPFNYLTTRWYFQELKLTVWALASYPSLWFPSGRTSWKHPKLSSHRSPIPGLWLRVHWYIIESCSTGHHTEVLRAKGHVWVHLAGTPEPVWFLPLCHGNLGVAPMSPHVASWASHYLSSLPIEIHFLGLGTPHMGLLPKQRPRLQRKSGHLASGRMNSATVFSSSF